jgi:hypothetical protein
MVFIPVPNAAEVLMNFTWNGEQVKMVFGVGWEAEPDSAAMLDIADDFDTWHNTNLKAAQTTEITLDSIDVIPQWDNTAPSVTKILTTPRPGTATGDSVPNNAAPCITLLTGLRGRSYRGRKYIPGYPETNVDGSLVGLSNLSALLTIMGAIVPLLSADDAALGVISRQLNNVARVIGVITAVTAFKADQIIDSQRRRLPGRGS